MDDDKMIHDNEKVELEQGKEISRFDAIKTDVSKLLDDVSLWGKESLSVSKEKLLELKKDLAEKRDKADEKRKELVGEGREASKEMMTGFRGAIDELKESYVKIKEIFSNK